MQRPKLYLFSLGLIFNRHLWRMLKSFGYRPRVGWPLGSNAAIAVWGYGKTAKRGEWASRLTGAPLLRLEDGFLRSVQTGREGDPPLSLVIDDLGMYYNPSDQNGLRKLFAESSRSSEQSMRARDGIDLLRATAVSKYNAVPDDLPSDIPDRCVLVIDQLRDDLSLRSSGAGQADFEEMLQSALDETPNLPVVIKSHPETIAGQRAGHFDHRHKSDRVILYDQAVNPWGLIKRAEAVYTCGSLLGFEALLMGLKPVVFTPCFYAGLGLTDDRFASAVLSKGLSREDAFGSAYFDYVRYFDPFLSTETSFERTVFTLEAKARHAKLPRKIAFAKASLWKRGFLKRYFSGAHIRFSNGGVLEGEKQFVWASKAYAKDFDAIKVEDGFIRSFGLGAKLVRPFSLCLDQTGIYYDPRYKSDLENAIERSVDLPGVLVRRARAVRERVLQLGVTKYNQLAQKPLPDLPEGQEAVLVVGQVEDDASILTATSQVTSNDALLARVRADFPDAYILYRPHPDVVAGLREGGKIDIQSADLIAADHNLNALLDRVDRVATMTSLTGFEALLRGKPVTCYGTPFYAGWGLTDDRGSVPTRRTARPSLDQLVYAALVDYPYYWDPVTWAPCSVETVLDRIELGQTGRKGGPFNRALSKAQGVLIGFGPFWR